MPNNRKTHVQEQVEAQLADAPTLTIKEIQALTNLSGVYIRKAIKSGKLVVVKSHVGDTKTPLNLITRESFDAWRANIRNGVGAREDGRNKFVLYMTAEEAADLMGKVAGTSYGETLKRANLSAAAKVEA